MEAPRSNRYYLAGKSGKLLKPGWNRTNRFDKGKTKRTYYVNPKGHWAKASGFFKVDGKRYYAVKGKGYVATGLFYIKGKGYVAAKSGAIVDSIPELTLQGINQAKTNNLRGIGKLKTAHTARIREALQSFRRHGKRVGFMFVDLASGRSISYNANKSFFGASTVKSGYCAYVLSQKVDKGKASFGSVRGRLYRTIRYSSNSAYRSLRHRFGSRGYMRWMSGVGARRQASDLWENYTPKELSRVWVRDAEYLFSGKGYSKWLRDAHKHSANSSIDQAVDDCDVYTKAGWMFPGTLNDSGIITDCHGRPFQLVILSTANGQDNYLLRALVRSLRAAAADMPW